MNDIEINPFAASVAALVAENGYSWAEAKKRILNENPHISYNELPKNEEIESALREHFAIFDPEGHKERLLELRKSALVVMKELEKFRPLLTKGVLSGCADKFSDIIILLESEDVKAVEIFLLDMNIDIEVVETWEDQKNSPVEEITFEAPLMRGGYFQSHDIPLTVKVKLFEHYPYFPNKHKKKPDKWQINEEATEIATINDLERLIELTERK